MYTLSSQYPASLSFIYPFSNVSVLCTAQLNLKHQIQKGKQNLYSNFWFVPNPDTFATLHSWTISHETSMLRIKELLAVSRKQCRCLLGIAFSLSFANRRDVAIVFHAHCLNPYRFFTDMNRNGLWEKGIAFPLERLFSLMANGIWSDAKSEQMWTGSGKSAPYQLWESDPTSGAKLQLQDPRFPCPWCSCTEEIPLADFCETHTTKTSICRCRSCGHQFDADTLSAKYLCDDLREFIDGQNGWLTHRFNHSNILGS